VMGNSVEEFVRHMGGGHGNSPQNGKLWTYGANPMPKGFCQSLNTAARVGQSPR
jgi:hypothetical protein